MGRSSNYVAVYDVSEDRERQRVAKVLEGYGQRVQYSAFELRLTTAMRQTLLRRLEALKLASGFVFLYRRAGGQDRAGVGCVPDDPLGEDRHAFVLVGGDENSRPSKPRTKRPHGETGKPARATVSASATDPEQRLAVAPQPLEMPVLPSNFSLPPAVESEEPAATETRSTDRESG